MKVLKILLAFLLGASTMAIAIRYPQEAFSFYFPLFTIAFGAYIMLVKHVKPSELTTLIGVGVIIRLLLIFVFPNLSDDIFRFYWDGLLWNDGINPFTDTPSNLLENTQLDSKYNELYGKLNSKDYFTIYPPVCQFLFYISGWFSLEGASIFFKVTFFIAELLSLMGLLKILKHLGRPQSLALFYFLNPLVLLEFCGNLHFECLVVCALIWMLYFFMTHRYALGGLLYGMAILTKVVPLIFGPLILLYLWKKQKWLNGLVPAGLFVLLGFAMIFLGQDIGHMLSSMRLYFQTFEFNASIYYVLREIGYWIYGYNKIADYGPLLAIIAFFAIVMISWLSRKDESKLPASFVWILLVYLIFSTTVHPWYIIPGLALAILDKRTLPLMVLWSFLIFISYSAYDSEPVLEHGWALGLEYGALLLAILITSKKTYLQV